jgi:hypothetical protein
MLRRTTLISISKAHKSVVFWIDCKLSFEIEIGLPWRGICNLHWLCSFVINHCFAFVHCFSLINTSSYHESEQSSCGPLYSSSAARTGGVFRDLVCFTTATIPIMVPTTARVPNTAPTRSPIGIDIEVRQKSVQGINRIINRDGQHINVANRRCTRT